MDGLAEPKCLGSGQPKVCAPVVPVAAGRLPGASREVVRPPLRRGLSVEALPAQALGRFPPVPRVAAADGAVVHLHLDARRDDGGPGREAVRP